MGLRSHILIPPRSAFADGAHYAAALAMLDGADRIRAALAHPPGEDRLFHLDWAGRSLDRGRRYLAASALCRCRCPAVRPEYGREALQAQLDAMLRQARALAFGATDPHLTGGAPACVIAFAP